jgi:hypothetical protein
MSVPARAKAKLEQVTSLKSVGASASEATTASVAIRSVADDGEVDLAVRAEASMFARLLAEPPTAESASRRDQVMARVQSFAGRNVCAA